MTDPTSLHPDGGPAQADDGNWDKWRALVAQAYARFLDMMLTQRPHYPGLTDYTAVERAGKTQGSGPWWWGAAGEIRETINSINAWGVRVHEWGAWNLVIETYENEMDRWDILNHFVEPVVFFCMLQPSSLADRLTVAAETLLHQANLFTVSEYLDKLDQDVLKPGTMLRRRDRHTQLKRLGQGWLRFDDFFNALEALDGSDYRKLTRNFRDLSNHSFAPRLMIGEVARALRSFGPYPDLVKQPDGSLEEIVDPTKPRAQYAMALLAPLPLDVARVANLAEYQRARVAMQAFAALVTELGDRMDAMAKPVPHAPSDSS